MMRRGSIYLWSLLAMTSAALGADELMLWKEATREGQELQQARKYEQAAKKFIDALRHAQMSNGQELTALTLNDLSSVSYQTGDFSRVQKYSRRALELFGRLGRQDRPGFAVALNNLAMADVEKGQYREADQLFRRSIECRVKNFGADHPLVATGFMNLAGLCLRMRRNAEAETLYRQALEVWQQKGEAHQMDIARCLNNLAALYRKQKRLGEAIPLLREALTKWEKVPGEARPEWAETVTKKVRFTR